MNYESDDLGAPMEDRSLELAWLLYHAHRYESAAQQLMRYLAQEPDDSEAHTLLSLCLSEIEDNEAIAAMRGISDALREAVEGIRQGPDRPLAYYAHAVAFAKLNRLKRAEAGVREAIRLDPENAHYYGFLAHLQTRAKSWAESLATSLTGLSIDPNDIDCSNIRALSLFYMGRYDEAMVAATQVLETDPENAVDHGILGLIELEKGRARQAVGHFQEVLRLDASLTWAVEGNIEAQQKSMFFYRFIASKVFWVADLPPWIFGTLMIAGWIAAHAAPRIAKGHPSRVVPVALALLIYFLLNSVVRVRETSPHAPGADQPSLKAKSRGHDANRLVGVRDFLPCVARAPARQRPLASRHDPFCNGRCVARRGSRGGSRQDKPRHHFALCPHRSPGLLATRIETSRALMRRIQRNVQPQTQDLV